MIQEIKQEDNDAAAIVGRLMKAAVTYWQARSIDFQASLSEKEIKLVIGLLGNKCQVVPTFQRCGRTTSIGLAALARYILLSHLDVRQIWVVPKGASVQLLSGQEHIALRDFLAAFGVELVDGSRSFEDGNLMLTHKYSNIIPVFDGGLPFDLDYKTRDYWKGINTVYLDNIEVMQSELERFSPICPVLAVAEKDIAKKFQSQIRDLKFDLESRAQLFGSRLDERNTRFVLEHSTRIGVHDKWQELL